MSVTTLTEAPHPLRRTSPSALADNAYEKLKLELLEGVLNPGDNLSVNELAREFECSRVPIMEALKRLEPGPAYPVAISPGLEALTLEVDRRLGFGKERAR